MKRTLLLLSCICFFAACSKPQPPAPPADNFDLPAAETDSLPDITIAQVGPERITLTHLENLLETLDPQDRQFAQTPLGRQNFIQLLIREKLAQLDAKEKGLDKSDLYLTDLEDKRAQLAEIYQAYAEQLLLHLWDDYLQQRQILDITDEEIEDYFKKYPYEMKIKQIIIADAETADVVLRELKHNKNRWKELERQYSVSPESSRGKEFSVMPGEFIPELEVIAANSPTGSVQGFVKTPQGFHIIMKTAEKRLSLKDAAPRIRTILENKKRDEVLNALQNKYEVVIYEQND